jgi:hypothetical protein
MGYRSSSGKCAPPRHPAEDHPQVLIIAPGPPPSGQSRTLKTWLLSEEGGWFRPALSKFETALKAITGLFFFSNYCEIFE